MNWRVSNKKSSKYSLGWIPFKSIAIQIQHGQIKYGGKWFNFWDSYDLNNYKDKIKTGCFVEDSRGRWYVCLAVEVEVNEKPVIENLSKDKIIGIDPGLKTLLTITNGTNHTKIEPQQNYRHFEKKLGIAQRANKKNLVKSIHAKIKNKRSNDLHQLSSHLVKNNQAIFIGDVSPKSLVKKKNKETNKVETKLSNKKLKRGMNKSVLDAGWSIFRNMLEYKCNHAGVYYSEIDERHTTQDCSCCGSRHSSPWNKRMDLQGV